MKTNSLLIRLPFKQVMGGLILFLFVRDLSGQVLPRYRQPSDFPDSSESRGTQMLFQLDFENGGMLYNNPTIKESLGDVYYNGVNIRVGWQTGKGGDAYHARHNFPIYGVGFYSSTFHKEEIGNPFALYGFVSAPVMPGKLRKWDFNYRISLGVAGNFRPYDVDHNPKNILVGSSNTVFIDFGLQANYRMNKHLQLGMGTAFHHFSNGTMRQPNKGINLLPVSVSLSYIPASAKPDFSKEPDVPSPVDDEFHLSYAAGIKQYTPEISRRYFKSTMGFYWSRYAGHQWRLGLGADIFYSQSGRDSLFAGSSRNQFRSLLSGGPSLYFDHILTSRLYLNGGFGVYLHRNVFNGELRPFFMRVGVRYRYFKTGYLGISIKAHQGKADYIEWTIGNTFRRKSKPAQK